MIGTRDAGWASPMLPGASFDTDVVLVAPREFTLSAAGLSFRERNSTTFTELMAFGEFQAHHIVRINEALGIESLASALQESAIRCAVLNINVAPHSPREIAEKVRASGARVVGISLIYRPQVEYALELCEALADVPDVVVCMGGALASFMPRELLARLRRLDAVVYGEAEQTFVDFVRAALDDEDWSGLPGIAYREGDAAVINPAGPALDLSGIVTPARHTLSFLRASGYPTRIASIYTSRGCMAKCTFCTGKDAYNVERRPTYRYRDPLDVADEVQALKERFGVDFVYINDDNFLGYGERSFERVRRFAQELIDRELGIQFATECRVDALDPQLLGLLKQAGMRQVLLGIESGSDAVLERWRKGASASQNLEAVRLLEELEINIEPGYILFDAHTTAQELRQNLAFIRDARLHRVTFPTYLVNRISVYPGTEIETLLVDDGTIAPSPIDPASPARDEPEAIRRYFERLEYRCRDAHVELSWRAIRRELDPVERFFEDELPRLTPSLVRVRGSRASAEQRRAARELIRRAGAWRRSLGRLVTSLLESVTTSLEEDAGEQAHIFLRRLRARLRRLRADYDQETLRAEPAEFIREAACLHREVSPVDVSVVIPSRARWSRLRRTLEALSHQEVADGLRWEVLLVLDGASEPEGLASLRERLPLRVERLRDRVGRAGARNAGVRLARGAIVIFLDEDVVVDSGFLRSHVEAQARRPSLCHGPQREVACLAGLIDLDSGETVDDLGEAAARRLRAVSQRVLDGLGEASAWDRHGSPSRLEREGMLALESCRRGAAWLAFAGANLSAPRAWLLGDGFDERAGTQWGLEDLTLALRWTMAGRPLTHAPGARGLHLSHHRAGWREAGHGDERLLDFLPNESTLRVENTTFSTLRRWSEIGELVASALGYNPSTSPALARASPIRSFSSSPVKE